MSRHLDLFGAIHVDRFSKVEDELIDFAEDADAEAIFVEWPAEELTRRMVTVALLRTPAMLLGTLFVGLIQGLLSALFNRRLDSTEHIAVKRLSDRYPVHEIDRNLFSLMADFGLLAVVANWAVLVGFLAFTPVQTAVTATILLVGSGLSNVVALRSRRLAAFSVVCVAIGLVALFVLTDLLAGWFLLALTLAFGVLANRTLDTRNQHMTERITTIADEEAYDSAVLVTGKAHLLGMRDEATDAGLIVERTYTPRWLRTPGKIEHHPETELDETDQAAETTAESHDSTDELGSAGTRAAASLIDSVALGVLVWIPAGALGVATGELLDEFVSGFLVGFFLTPLAYYVILEAAFGRTLGKHLEELVVTDAEGAPASVRACVLRNLLRPVDFLLFYAFGFVMLLLTDRRQRLGDFLAGTEVRKTG